MSTAPHTRPATWEEYLALGENCQAEYIDGQIVMSPTPSRPHQDACDRLKDLLRAAVPATHAVISSWSWKPDANEYIPDVMVYPRTDEEVRFTGTPALAVEVLSSNRADDLVWKLHRYAQAGLRHYWILDLRGRVLLAHELVEGHFVLRARVTLENPAEVSFGVGSVSVDLAEILAPF